MPRSKPKGLPASKSVEEFVEFFETHDMSDYWDQMPEAHFDIDVKRRTHLVAIDEDIASKLTN
ncbi:MAG TPA: CopG family antitoxin [Blastocatellia bacterium]|nr:CopG family antitoxin [Blastocatellia bacterium]